MQVEVLLFAAARDLAGATQVLVELPEAPTVADLRVALAQQHLGLAPLIASCRIAVDGDFAFDSQRIEQKKELALIPPVSGG
ncbi:MoaD/ThiS family protein [Aeoliella mucimassa]|uniref:Molybdopterin synthase sulfur carrier subunit n=1 Tax=Aeoliella mucimassa TaxID=2527972 RepID=A0A518AQV6_9BACT|nr:MoaD/ThiS family protein [Aeoliella mucimassa]QDU57095.1 ThiS family protein [Aeoliella mucimassa]